MHFKEQFTAYIQELKTERNNLLARVAEIELELKEFETLTTVVKEPVTKSEAKKRCSLCNGHGTYNDSFAGFVDCHECNGKGWK